jgi:hypothetical protein
MPWWKTSAGGREWEQWETESWKEVGETEKVLLIAWSAAAVVG